MRASARPCWRTPRPGGSTPSGEWLSAQAPGEPTETAAPFSRAPRYSEHLPAWSPAWVLAPEAFGGPATVTTSSAAPSDILASSEPCAPAELQQPTRPPRLLSASPPTAASAACVHSGRGRTITDETAS
eukprot:1564648-Prymnesium_polylepis.4